MQVVLLERVAKLGQMGEVVAVKDGYARNFLLPQGKALRATEANLKRFETDRAQLEARNLEAEEGGREGREEARRPVLRGDSLRLRRRRPLRLGHHPRHRRRRHRRRLHPRPPPGRSRPSDQGARASTRSASPSTPRSPPRSPSTSPAAPTRPSCRPPARPSRSSRPRPRPPHEFDIQELFDDIGGAADEDGPLPDPLSPAAPAARRGAGASRAHDR